MKLEFKFADVVDDHEIKMEAMRLDHEIKMNAMRLKLKRLENMPLVKRLGIIMLLVQ